MLAWMFQKISQYNFQRFFSPLTGFPAGVENTRGGGGFSKFDGGGGLSQYMKEAWRGLKILSKIPVKEFI